MPWSEEVMKSLGVTFASSLHGSAQFMFWEAHCISSIFKQHRCSPSFVVHQSFDAKVRDMTIGKLYKETRINERMLNFGHLR
jgi:hypothetical protein